MRRLFFSAALAAVLLCVPSPSPAAASAAASLWAASSFWTKASPQAIVPLWTLRALVACLFTFCLYFFNNYFTQET